MSTDNPRTPESGPGSSEPSANASQPVAPIIPAAPRVPTAPQLPVASVYPADHDPSAPGLPGAAGIPGAPGLPGAAGFHGAPGLPGTPVAPIVPGSVAPGGAGGHPGAPTSQTNVVAIVALALAAAGFFSAFFPGNLAIGILLLIPAFVLGIIGLILPRQPRLLAIIAVIVSVVGGITGVITTAIWIAQTVNSVVDGAASDWPDDGDPVLPGDGYGSDEYGADEYGADEFGADPFGADESGTDDSSGAEDYFDVPGTYPVDVYAMPGIIGEFGYGDTASFSNGINVQLSAPEPYEPTESAAGEDGGVNLRLEITVTNTSDEAFDPLMMSVLGVSEGYSVSEIFDNNIESYLSESIPAGDSVTYSAAFSVADVDDLVFEVVPDVTASERAIVG